MTFSIPTHKCGLVIGRGGENVKAINQQTGAFVEISRQLPPNGDPNFKLFVIRGSPQQIDPLWLRHALLPSPGGGEAPAYIDARARRVHGAVGNRSHPGKPADL